MDNRVIESLRMVVIACLIALVLNLVRILIFEDGDFTTLLAFSREERLRDNIYQTQNDVEQIRQRQRRMQARTAASQNNAVNSNGNNPRVNKIFPTINTIVNINVKEPMNFNGLPRNTVLSLRENVLKTSPIFSEMSYSPSSEVFRIVDNKPWISLEGALHFNSRPANQRIVGLSRESIGILNPEFLYYVSLTENEDGITDDFKPLYKDFYFIPYKAEYNRQTNTITVYIKGPKYEGGGHQPIFLSDSNAHDLGYRYAYMESSENVGFYTDEPYRNNTLKSKIQSPEGFYMCGSACGVEGGCNNYAPYWQYYNFLFLRRLPARFNIKLWHNRPQTTQAPADINFEMVFE